MCKNNQTSRYAIKIIMIIILIITTIIIIIMYDYNGNNYNSKRNLTNEDQLIE